MTRNALEFAVKAFCFDVFGTCVDWRTSVTGELHNEAQKAVSEPSAAPHAAIRAKAMTREDWGTIAAEWRQTYHDFTRTLAADPNATFKTVDQHHHDALIDLLEKHSLTGLWTDAQVAHLAQVWHRLDPWPDTREGLRILGLRYATATLSNGNVSLLRDLQAHGGLRFAHTYSADMFGTYKPNPKVYLGAVERLGAAADPGEVAMVAAHLGDLKAAKGCGLRTVYVEREGEESGDRERAKAEGYVDSWIGEGEGGFLGIVREMGLG